MTARTYTMAAVTVGAKAFLDPVLAGDVEATWDPEHWRWQRSG